VKKPYVVAVALLALLGAAAGVYAGRERLGLTATTVRGVVGSEKAAFFADPAVVAAFAEHGLRLDLDPRGSLQMAGPVDLGPYDFAFPSSEPAAERIRARRGGPAPTTPFSSPLAVATFAPILDLLAGHGIASRAPGGQWIIDMPAYLAAAARGLRWDQIPGNTVYQARRSVLITTTSPAASNSAALYAAVAEAAGAARDAVVRLFQAQGVLETQSEAPFERYRADGLGYAPLVLVYEAQYLRRQLPPDRAMAYLSPTARSGHTVVPFTDRGAEVARLLAGDPTLRDLAVRHGFRTDQRSLPVEAIQPPSYAELEALIRGVPA